MYCPNCGKQSQLEQKFCRSCGLNLEKTFESLLEQKQDSFKLQSNKFPKIIDKLGTIGLTGVISFGLLQIVLIANSISDKIVIGAIIIFAIIFALISIIPLVYSKIFTNPNETKKTILQNEIELNKTANFLEEQPLQQVPTVTENSTELLYVKNRTNKIE